MIFSASMNIILVLSVGLFFIFETIGLWFVNNELSIPSERLFAANCVFQSSLITLWFGLLQQPFTAAIFAQEEMGAFALISLTECMLRLGVIFFIGISDMDGLIFYSIGLSAVAMIIFLLYAFIVRRRYPEYKYCRKIPKETYHSLLAFSGWSMYSSLAAVGLTQGITILLYMFFGPIATAAYAIAQQVFHAFTALSNSIAVAFRPAMVKSFAEKDYISLNKMFSANNKFILYLLLMVAIPLILELRTIFDWWLGNVSEEAIIYTRLTIIYLLCFSMHNPVTTIVQSTGQLRHYSLYVDSILLLCLPATWLAFHLGASSEISIALMIVMCFAAHQSISLIPLWSIYFGNHPARDINHCMHSFGGRLFSSNNPSWYCKAGRRICIIMCFDSPCCLRLGANDKRTPDATPFHDGTDNIKISRKLTRFL